MWKPLVWLADRGLDLMIYAFNWTSAHMTFTGALYTTLALGYVSAKFIRGWWPERSHRPRWARGLLAVCDPVAAAVAGLLERFGRVSQPGPVKVPDPSAWRAVGKHGGRKAGVRPRKHPRAS